jgi:hypothetical protein
MVTRRRFILGGALLLVEKTGSGAGRVEGVSSPATIELNINNDSWAGGWDQPGEGFAAQRVNMEYSNAYVEYPNGRQLEFSIAQHARGPGDNTGVRWAQFAATGAPTMGYYWPNNDKQIYETDNMPTFYLPWRQWVVLVNHKIIDIATPSAVLRWPSEAKCLSEYKAGRVLDMSTVIEILKASPGWPDSYWRSNYNPACDVNPGSGLFTFTFGGGYFNSFPNGVPSLVRILDDNPDYPSRSTKPLRMRVFSYTGVSPTHARHAVRVAGHSYWGASGMLNSNGRPIASGCNEFYRIRIADLANGIVTQERLPDIPLSTTAFGNDAFAGGWRYALLCADELRKKVIVVTGQGVCRYTVPPDNGANGTWEGPLTFGMTTQQWAKTISDGKGVLTGAPWHGFIGTHHSGLNQTNFRYNLSRRWNVIRWNS